MFEKIITAWIYFLISYSRISCSYVCHRWVPRLMFIPSHQKDCISDATWNSRNIFLFSTEKLIVPRKNFYCAVIKSLSATYVISDFTISHWTALLIRLSQRNFQKRNISGHGFWYATRCFSKLRFGSKNQPELKHAKTVGPWSHINLKF